MYNCYTRNILFLNLNLSISLLFGDSGTPKMANRLGLKKKMKTRQPKNFFLDANLAFKVSFLADSKNKIC